MKNVHPIQIILAAVVAVVYLVFYRAVPIWLAVPVLIILCVLIVWYDQKKEAEEGKRVLDDGQKAALVVTMLISIFFLYPVVRTVIYIRSINYQIERRDDKKAREEADRALDSHFRLAPLRERAAAAYMSLAWSVLRGGDLEQSLNLADKAARIEPRNAKILLSAGKLAIDAQDLDSAYKFLSMALTADPKNFETLMAIGDVCQRREDYAQAAEYFERARDLRPDDPTVAQNLAEVENKVMSEEGYAARNSPNFRFRFEPWADELWQDRMEAACDNAYSSVGAALGRFGQRPVKVVFYDADQVEPQDINAVYYDGIMRIGFSGNGDFSEDEVYRQYTQALILEIAGNKPPRWFRVGLSEWTLPTPPDYVSKARSLYMNSMLQEVSIPKLEDELRHATRSPDSVVYNTADLAVYYLSDAYGREAPGRVLVEFEKVDDMNDAMNNAVGVDLKEFESGFNTWIKEFINGAH